MDFDPQHGVSLIELVVAVALISIVTAIALPTWNKLLPSYQLDSSVRQFQSELHLLKMRAVAENVSFQLVYSSGADAYTIQKESTIVAVKPMPEGVAVTNAGTISFSSRGTAAANRIKLRSSDGTCKQVIVSPTGRIRSCKPSDCGGDC